MKRAIAAVSAAAILVAGLAGPASARPFPTTITIDGATSAEGVATGAGSTFYAGDLFAGDIYRGDLRSGATALLVDAPAGRMALGLKADVRHGLLFVAGGFTGQAYVYDLRSGADVAVYQLGGIVNDVAVTRDAAWFTDSAQPHLYRVPIASDGSVGPAETLVLSGPAAQLTGAFNLNGIAATPNGDTLLVAHSANGTVYAVDPWTGASFDIPGADTPSADGILLEAGTLWVVQNFLNQVSELRLAPDLSSASVVRVITSPDFQIPTTVARHGSRLAVVNAKFDTGLPPTAPSYEVVLVDAR